ncbi:Uncharacterized protein DAT39_011799, partial [Clarias magur]
SAISRRCFLSCLTGSVRLFTYRSPSLDPVCFWTALFASAIRNGAVEHLKQCEADVFR